MNKHELLDIFDDVEPQKLDRTTKWLIVLLVVGFVAYGVISYLIGCEPVIGCK